MSEIYVEPVGLSQSLELYLEGKRLDKEIAQLVAIANNPNATSTERVNAAVALSALTNDSNFTQLYDYLPDKKGYCDSAVTDTMAYLHTCTLPGLTDSADASNAPVTIGKMVDDVIANKQTNYKMTCHFDNEDSISAFSNISKNCLKNIVDHEVVIGYDNGPGGDGHAIMGNGIGKNNTLPDGRVMVMTENQPDICSTGGDSFDVKVTGAASDWNYLKAPTAADASLTSKYC